ncbi:hypothetical protein, partial [Sinorhizobium medicae]
VCPLWPADIPPALCRKARPSAATYTTSRDTILASFPSRLQISGEALQVDDDRFLRRYLRSAPIDTSA